MEAAAAAGAYIFFFFKLDLGLEKCLLFSSGLYLHKH